jgi:hypothetical protein
MKMLSKHQWQVLNSLADGSEPFEQITIDALALDPTITPGGVLSDVYALYGMGYVSIDQVPLCAADQTFNARAINPTCEEEVVGDLREQYLQFEATGDYLVQVDHAGVPFGVYLDVTDAGRVEWDRNEYNEYIEDC